METGTRNEAVVDLHKALLTESAAIAGSQSVPVMSGTARALKTPGGFRRAYLHAQADAKGIAEDARPAAWSESLLSTVRPLARVGYFEHALGLSIGTETASRGDVGVVATVIGILKSFLGSGLLFLPGAYASAGWALASVLLVAIAALNAVCIGLLLEACVASGVSDFGQLALRASGPIGKTCVHVSLVVSQFSTVICYFLFIAEVANSLDSEAYIDNTALAALEFAAMAPLGLLRSVAQLETPMLLADAGIFAGLAVVLYTLMHTLSTVGAAPTAVAFDLSSCGIFMGTAIFTFEGLPLVLPIRNAMQKRERFWPLFQPSFTFIVVLFVFIGAAGYLTFGADTPPVLLSALPNTAVANVTKLVYVLALVLSTPLQFIPAARVTELWVFGEKTKEADRVWGTNALRIGEYVCFALVALYGHEFFQVILALTGALTCAPIAFIYPSWFHLKTAATSRWSKAVDYGCLCLGVAAMLFVFSQAIGTIAEKL
uniref:Amino acid transporter transmembrane domain-containing protein n=1 Tax=Chrysotila carterae TaxID=13221 RepID=A0A7S4BHV5_CHRCT|mmetsp:Transcript_9393/g.18400  ORF Transcript_9393/g.18400 Transcript_9393/m.18400 type:complete len:488 (+) Transcript_9393:66-1529(+)